MEEPKRNKEQGSFSLEGYQIARGEFFPHLAEPSITFDRYRIYMNTACIRKAPDVEFVQVMVHAAAHKIALHLCDEDEKDAFAWCTPRRRPRKVRCPVFFAMIMELMNWDPQYRYRILGEMTTNGTMQLFVFDLSSAVAYPILQKTDLSGKRTVCTPRYPEEWKNQFGLPVEKHRQRYQINIFDQFVVFSVKNNTAPSIPYQTVPHGQERNAAFLT